MNLNEFLVVSMKQKHQYPEWRVGQTYFNVLRDMAPELAERVREENCNPFYVDAHCQAFLEWLSEQPEVTHDASADNP